MKWYKRGEKTPRPNDIIVAYTPDELNPELTYRLLKGGSLRLCTEATYLLFLEHPNTQLKMDAIKETRALIDKDIKEHPGWYR